MVYGLVQLCAVACMLATPFVAGADLLFDEKTAKEIAQMLDANACATGCQAEISGTIAKIELVDINFDKKGEYLVTLTENCGSAGCPGALFMRRGGAWVKLAEGLGLRILDSRTKGFSDLMANYGKLSWNGRSYDVVIRPPR
jgi:hypothetical protein